MPKCDFNKVACNSVEIALQHKCSPVNFLHIFRTSFYNDVRIWRAVSEFKDI